MYIFRETYVDCAEKCPKSPALDYLIAKHPRYLELVCRIKNGILGLLFLDS